MWDAYCLIFSKGRGTSKGKAKENRAVCTLHATLSTKKRIWNGMWDARHLIIALPILPAYSSLLVAAPVSPSYYPICHLTWWHGVIWVIRNQWHWIAGGCHWWLVTWQWCGVLGQGCRCCLEVVMWHWWVGLSLSLGAGDVALVGKFIGIVGRFGIIGGWVTWWHDIVGGQRHWQAHPGLAQY